MGSVLSRIARKLNFQNPKEAESLNMSRCPQILIFLFSLIFLACSKPLVKPSESVIIHKRLNQLQTQLVSFVTQRFPQATKEERDELLKVFVTKMKNKIAKQLGREEKGRIFEEKGDLLARMLR